MRQRGVISALILHLSCMWSPRCPTLIAFTVVLGLLVALFGKLRFLTFMPPDQSVVLFTASDLDVMLKRVLIQLTVIEIFLSKCSPCTLITQF